MTSKSYQKTIKDILNLGHVLFLLVLCMLFSSSGKAYANEDTVYKDGVYCYRIISKEDKKVQLIGIEKTEEAKEVLIPGKAIIDSEEYTVSMVYFDYDYYENDDYAKFYDGVKKINVADNFTGILSHPNYAFSNLDTIEFYGKILPEKVYVSLYNRNLKDFLFIVPKGMEDAYSKVISIYINYYVVSDLYEQDIELTPTIVSEKTKNIEYSYFSADGLIYKVTERAENKTGKVQLVGITHLLKKDYLKLPDKVSYNGYSYKLTSLGRFGLIGCGARVIVVPDSVTDMAIGVFDSMVELLFLSKNCKVIPSYVIADENEQTNLRFVYVPEGVTTISDNAFNGNPLNTASIILPATINKIGKKSLYTFKLVTFLNNKPLNNVASAVKKGTTVKVNEKVISTFKKALKSNVSVVAAKNIVKTTDITVNKENINISTIKTASVKATLTKGSNETVYWLSTNTDIIEISSKGVITPKKAGTAHVVAYTRTSGRHKAIKVTVNETTFDDGIFTYKVTNPSKKTVSLCQIRPDKTVKTITIPETITYKNVKYTVTSVIADPDNTAMPLIPEEYSNNKVKKITFPKSITGKVGYLGILKSIESITFKGKTAPEAICDWYKDGGILAWQAVIYVPKGSAKAYGSSLWLVYGDNSTYQEKNYGCAMDYNIVESGNDQVMRFVVDGILYRVKKYAGKGYGEVAVKGVDVNLKKIVINNTVTYKGYTYKVTEIYKNALRSSNDIEIYIDSSIKRNTKESSNIPVL